MSRFQPRGPTPRHLSGYQLAKDRQSSLHQPSDANRAAGGPLTPAPTRPGRAEPSRPHAGRFARLSPVRPDGWRTDPPGRSCSHLASHPATPTQSGRPGTPLLPRSPAQRTVARATYLLPSGAAPLPSGLLPPPSPLPPLEFASSSAQLGVPDPPRLSL